MSGQTGRGLHGWTPASHAGVTRRRLRYRARGTPIGRRGENGHVVLGRAVWFILFCAGTALVEDNGGWAVSRLTLQCKKHDVND